MPGRPKTRAKRLAAMAEAAAASPYTHTEICNQIIDELRVISREEWFAIAKYGKPGGPGFSPMYQLQTRIRDNPLTFIPELMAVFLDDAGKLLQRIIPWPETGWKVSPRAASPYRGFVAHGALDMHPYRTLEPVVDMLDRDITEFGLEAAQTLWTSQKLVRLCLEDFNYGKSNQ